MNDDSHEDFSTFVYHPGRAKSALPLSGGSLTVDRHATSAGLPCVHNKSVETGNRFLHPGVGRGGSSPQFICLQYSGIFDLFVYRKCASVVQRAPGSAECSAAASLSSVSSARA